MQTISSFLLFALVVVTPTAATTTDYRTPWPEPLPIFVAAEGRVLIEAEIGTGDWTVIANDRDGHAVQATEGKAMRYLIDFREAGTWYVWLRCRHGGNHSTNDAFVTLGGQPLYGVDRSTRPVGIRCHDDAFSWWSLPKGPGAHTPDAIRDDPVEAFIPQPGVYALEIAYRSPVFAIDQILLTTSKETPTE